MKAIDLRLKGEDDLNSGLACDYFSLTHIIHFRTLIHYIVKPFFCIIRGGEFRTAFKRFGSLKVFFPDIPFVALSGTLTVE